MSNNPFITNTPAPAPAGATMPGQPATADSTFECDFSQSDNLRLPEGNYKAKLTDIEQTVSKSGNPMFVWTFEIAGEAYTGRTFKNYTALTPAAMWKVQETVEALGVPTQNGMAKFKRSDVVGKFCGLAIVDDEYNGKPGSRIGNVLPLSSVENAR